MKSKTTITTETWYLTRIEILSNGTSVRRTATHTPLSDGETAGMESPEADDSPDIEPRERVITTATE